MKRWWLCANAESPRTRVMGSACAGNDYGAPAPSHPFDAYSIRGYSGCKRSPTGRPGGLRTRSGAITISTLFTAAMPLSHDWQRTSHCSTRKRRRLGVRLLQLFHVTRSLRGFKRSKCQRFALASHLPAETSFSPSLHERSRNAPSSHGVVAAQFSGTQSALAAPAHVTMQHPSQKRKPSRCIVLCFARPSRDARNSPSSVSYAEDRDPDTPEPISSWLVNHFRATRLGHVQLQCSRATVTDGLIPRVATPVLRKS